MVADDKESHRRPSQSRSGPTPKRRTLQLRPVTGCGQIQSLRKWHARGQASEKDTGEDTGNNCTEKDPSKGDDRRDEAKGEGEVRKRQVKRSSVDCSLDKAKNFAAGS